MTKLKLPLRRGPYVERPVTVEDARDWFQRFGLNPDCISPTGRRMFAALLAELDRIERKPSHD